MKLTYIYKSEWVYVERILNVSKYSGDSFRNMSIDYLMPDLKIVHIHSNQHLKKYGWGVERKLFRKVIGLL